MQALPGPALDLLIFCSVLSLHLFQTILKHALHIFLRSWDRSDTDPDSPQSWYTFHRIRRPFNHPLQEGKQAKLRWIKGGKKRSARMFWIGQDVTPGEYIQMVKCVAIWMNLSRLGQVVESLHSCEKEPMIMSKLWVPEMRTVSGD